MQEASAIRWIKPESCDGLAIRGELETQRLVLQPDHTGRTQLAVFCIAAMGSQIELRREERLRSTRVTGRVKAAGYMVDGPRYANELIGQCVRNTQKVTSDGGGVGQMPSETPSLATDE